MCTDKEELSEPLLKPGGREHSSKHYYGLACNTTAALTFGTISILVKMVDLPLPLMLQLRSIMQLVLALAGIAWRLRGVAEEPFDIFFAPRKLRMLLVARAFMYYGFMMLWWAALSTIPPGDAVAIVYCNPIISAIFASLLLGEPTNPAVPYCLVTATIGVLLIVQPSFLFASRSPVSPAYLTGASLAGGSAVLAGLLPLAVRKSRSVHWTTVEHITALYSALVASPLFILAWLSSDGADGTVTEKLLKLVAPGGLLLSWNAVGVLLIACFTFFGLAMQTIGYQNVESTAAAGVMTYLEVPYVFVLQALIFGEIADNVEILGVVLILTSGMITVFYKQIFACFQR